MRSGVVVLPEPAIDHNLCQLGRCEPFGIENLAAERSIEPLILSFLPGRAQVDPDRATFLWLTRQPSTRSSCATLR